MNSLAAQRQFAIDVVKKLRVAGFDALWAGGCVRDQLLGIDPKDFDVATSASPDQVREVFGRKKTIAIGASFGVITVLGSKEEGQIEVATFRQDANYSDGRRPDSVEFSTPEKDAQRRDFTINGLFFDPVESEVIDFVDGQTDIKQKVIRAIGNAEDRIAEDKLRMLRAVRFAATYEFEIDSSTLVAIQRHAESIKVVSRERIAAELRRMFSHRNRGSALRLLVTSRLFETIFENNVGIDLTNVDEAIELIQHVDSGGFEVGFAAMLIPLLNFDLENGFSSSRKRQLLSLLNQWKFSNQESSMIGWLLSSLPVVLKASGQNWPTVQRVLIDDKIDNLMFLGHAVSKHVGGTFAQALEFCQRKLELPVNELNPEPLLTGDDLKGAGFQPGKKFKLILDAIRNKQLDGLLLDFADAIEEANRLWAGETPGEK